MNGKDLTQGSILGNIMTFSLPYMLAYFLQILYGLADLYVIGQYCDVDSTTAVSNGAQVMYMVTVVLIGLAMGTTVLTARAVGAKDSPRARIIVGNTITMFAIIAIVLMVVLLCLRGWIVGVMDTPAEAVDGMKHYLTVCFTGIPFIIAYNIISSIFRGLGDSRSPMYFVAVACVIKHRSRLSFHRFLRAWRNGGCPWYDLVANDKRVVCLCDDTPPSWNTGRITFRPVSTP